MKKYFLLLLFLTLVSSMTFSRENVPFTGRIMPTEIYKIESGCDPASAAVNLDINNVRARIMNGGDMWWDLVQTAAYEIPKTTKEGETKKTSLFAGALWIGGYDDGKQLREAAMTYRQNGNDFFPGPLDPNTASIEYQDCKKWDKIFQVNRNEINQFIDKKTITDDIRYWPAHSFSYPDGHAPFIDADGNGSYDPDAGDYPDVLGDQTLWFVYNDKGNSHQETKALAIGLEVQTMAFAFATNDEINNMTFYKQTIINRSKNKLNDVYFGQWVDPDLGYAYDDYVGCDTTRDLGICYNGEDFDPGATGYGANPPSVGVDFFEGPNSDIPGKKIGMTKFVYYNNDFSVNGNPFDPQHYYNFLDGKWHNGQCMKYGGDGYNNFWQDRCVNFMFPDDPRKPKPFWSEVSAKNTPGDRRFLQSAGKFTLKPGAVNNVTIGVVWARSTSGGATGSYDLLMVADDKAQKLFNNNFKLLDGPDAPDLVVQELDKELILSLENTLKTEKYYDSTLSSTSSYIKYKFQGYQIYQLVNSSITPSDLDNPDNARLIYRCDIIDGVKQLVNRQYVPGLGIVPVEKVDDAGGDQGVKHTFSLKTDAFSSGNSNLVNNKQYYFMVLSYSNASDPNDYIQYLAGRKNIKVYTATPHKTDIEYDGNKLGSKYGDGPSITRIEGTGNGGMTLELTDKCIADIFAITNGNYTSIKPEYKGGNGPINIYVYDPLKVPNGTFTLTLTDTTLKATAANYKKLSYNSTWTLTRTDVSPNVSVQSDVVYGKTNEQIFPLWGLAAKIDKVVGPSSDTVTTMNGFIEATMTFQDISQRWLTGIGDGNLSDRTLAWPYNWIRAGKYQRSKTSLDQTTDDVFKGPPNAPLFYDPNAVYEKLLNGIIAPYALVAKHAENTSTQQHTYGMAFPGSFSTNQIEDIPSIDLVFTPDKTKWTQCLVIEMCEDDPTYLVPGFNYLSEGKVKKFHPRAHDSWLDPNAIDANGNPIYSSSEQGRSWFPGYAINLETGERLNIIFSEDSYFQQENGRDMLWNPTFDFINPAASDWDVNRYIWGGKHFIYIMGSQGKGVVASYATAYDGGKKYLQFFKDNPNNATRTELFYYSALYTMLPIIAYPNHLKSLTDGLIPTETKIRIRIEKPYAVFNKINTTTPQNRYQPFYTFTTSEIAMTKSNEFGKDAMDLINIVPNPYYGYSEYEKNQLDNRVRFTNLPKKCEISIFTLSGILVRKFKQDQTDENHTTFLDWDLKNQAGVPVASGLYIIYVNGFDLGHKTLKWFGIMRPLDMDTF